MERELLIPKEAQMLYKPSYEVSKITKMIEKVIIDANTKKVELPYNFTIGSNKVNYVELDDFSVLLVHWAPDFKVSRLQDPYCSALILKYKELQKLYREVVRLLY